MPKLYNTVTQKWMFMPDSYVGQAPFITEEEAAELPVPVIAEIEEPTEPAKPAKPAKKRKAEYVPAAIDADNDGRVQDGTIFERPVGTELSPEEMTAILEESDK